MRTNLGFPLQQEGSIVRDLLLPVIIAASSAFGTAQAAESPLCKLFNQKEAIAYVGAPLGEGESSLIPGALGCSWSEEGTGNKLSVSVFPAGNALQLKAWGFESWEGFRAVPGIGAKAYVARSPIMEIMGRKMGGEWQAGAIVGDDYVAVGLKGPKASADAALTLLSEAVRRRQR